MLVCDGLDEVSYGECELLEIIAGRMYPNVRCIVTCRPHASLGMSLTADAEIRLKGFSKQQAGHYVDMYFIHKYPSNRNLAEQESIKLWNDIESSPDLLEMSINPSMLQLLCKMFLATGKIAKDRATVFKDYTYFLLQQNHIKLHAKPVGHTELKNMYKGIILKAGHLALQGLKQTHLQLMFTKESVIELAGKEMFDIGFVTEIPGHGFEKPKAQFQHKTHQEYLAAYFIVKSSDDVGMKYLMEFCSTSKGLMGSQIILTFITAMSKRMGKVIQKKIIDLVSSWESEDDISPKDRTSFLLTMLKENKSLSFPLPKDIDINIREYEKSSDWFQKVLQKFGKKSALVTFFTFDNRGAEKIALVLGKEHRLELLNNFKNSQLQEVSLNFQRKCIERDQVNLSGLIQRNEKVKFLSLKQLLVQDLVSICRNSEFISCLVKSDNLKTIRLPKCETAMNTELADAFKHFPSHVELDISGNRVTNQFVCKALIQNAAHLASLIMQDCGIIIDAEIAEDISQLPEQANLDLSGNTVTKMDSSLLCHVIPVISNKKIDLSELGIQICTEIAAAISRLPDHTELDLSGNQVTDESACITLIHKGATMKSLHIHNCMSNCFIQIDIEIAKAVSRLHDHTDLDLSGNQVTEKSACITLIHKAASMKSLNICSCGIQIDTDIAEAVSRLPDHTQLDISDNQVTDKSACITLIQKAATMKSLNIHNCMYNSGMKIDAKIAQAVSRLPDHTQLDLSGNQVTDKSVCIALINKAATMKSLSLCNCGIQIDTEIAVAISQLPEQDNLDLSGNRVTKMDSSLLCHVIPVISNKKIDLSGLGMCIDADVAHTLFLLSKEVETDLSGNHIAEKSVCISLIRQAATCKPLGLSDCDIVIDAEIAETISLLPKHANVDLSGNRVTKMDSSLLCHVIPVISNRKIDLSGLGMCIDADVAHTLFLLSKEVETDLSGNHIAEKSVCISLIRQAATCKPLGLSDCGIVIDAEIAEAISLLPKHANVDLSGNTVTKMDSRLLCHVIPVISNKKIDLSGLGVVIDQNVAQALCSLDKDVKVDISDNAITHMDYQLLCQLLYSLYRETIIKIHTKETIIKWDLLQVIQMKPSDTHFDISYNDTVTQDIFLSMTITADKWKPLFLQDKKEVALYESMAVLPQHLQLQGYVRLEIQAFHVPQMRNPILPIITGCIAYQSKVDLSHLHFTHNKNTDKSLMCLPESVELDMTGNDIASKDTCIKLIKKAGTLSALRMQDCGIIIDTEIAEAISHLPEQANLDLSGNPVANKSVCIALIHKAATMKSLSICNCGIQIDAEIAEAIFRLPDPTELDLSGNKVTDKCACITLIHKAATMKSLSICNCGIQIDTEIAEAVSRLPDHTELDLSGSQVTCKSACITLIQKAATMKSLNIHDCMSNCGIQIDAEIAEAVSRLPDHTQLDLSGIKVTDKSACISLIYKAATMKSLNIGNCGIQIDTEIAEAVSRLPHHTQFCLEISLQINLLVLH